jgi:hypothetical protein
MGPGTAAKIAGDRRVGVYEWLGSWFRLSRTGLRLSVR